MFMFPRLEYEGRYVVRLTMSSGDEEMGHTMMMCPIGEKTD